MKTMLNALAGGQDKLWFDIDGEDTMNTVWDEYIV